MTTAMEVLGGRWKLLALYWLADGMRRFSDLQRLIPEVTHKVLEYAELAGRTSMQKFPRESSTRSPSTIAARCQPSKLFAGGDLRTCAA
jgi:hypothetical protein